jgi:hypothetical protein
MWAIGTGGIGTVTRSGARGVALLTLRTAMKRTFTRRLARKIVVNLAKDTTKAILAGTMKFATTFSKTYYTEAKMQRLANRTRSGQAVDRLVYDVSLKKAAGEFVATFITTLLDLRLDKLLKETGYSAIQQELSKRIIQAFGTNIPATFINGIAKAWAAEDQHPGSFPNQLAKELLSELKNRFTSLVKVDFKKAGEAIMK